MVIAPVISQLSRRDRQVIPYRDIDYRAAVFWFILGPIRSFNKEKIRSHRPDNLPELFSVARKKIVDYAD